MLRKKLVILVLLSALLLSSMLQPVCSGVDLKQPYTSQFEGAFPESMWRGVNMGNALEAPNEGEWGVYIEDEYFRIIREAGFDTVRIPIKWSNHAEKQPPYRVEDAFFKRVDHVVNKSLGQNLTTIINIHHYDEIMQKPLEHKGRFIALWRQISERYKNYPETLYFELLNEPMGALTDDLWNQFIDEAVRTIREANPTRKIIIGPTGWNSVYNLRGLVIPAGDENIIVTFHFYTPFQFTHQGAEWVSPSPPLGRKWYGTELERRQIMDELDIAVKWAVQHSNVTLLMGEFGAYSKADMNSRVRWTSFVVREAEKRNIAWCYWEFCSGFGAYDPVRNEWRNMLLNALIPKTGLKHHVAVDTECGSFSGIGLYDEGSYATIRLDEPVTGFLIKNIFERFEHLGPEDRVVDARTVEVYVDGPREVKAVWRKDYTGAILLAIGIFLAVLLCKKLKK